VGALPPSKAREFEELIMVPRAGSNTWLVGSIPTLGLDTSLGRHSNSNNQIAGEEEMPYLPLTPTHTCA